MQGLEGHQAVHQSLVAETFAHMLDSECKICGDEVDETWRSVKMMGVTKLLWRIVDRQKEFSLDKAKSRPGSSKNSRAARSVWSRSTT